MRGGPYNLTPEQARVLEVMDGNDVGADAEVIWQVIPDFPVRP
jgi:hypothetical protein